MFRRPLAMIIAGSASAAFALEAKLMTMKRQYNIKSFRDKFQELAFRGMVANRKQRYVKVYTGCGKRERARRILNCADLQQLNCHKPGTVQPKHIFGVVQ